MSIFSLICFLHDLYKSSGALLDILFAASLGLYPKVFGFSVISSFPNSSLFFEGFCSVFDTNW